jgi:hypothetical protein
LEIDGNRTSDIRIISLITLTCALTQRSTRKVTKLLNL